MPHQLRLNTASTAGETTPVDPAKLLSGTPVQTTDNQFTNERGNLFAGVWGSEPGKWRISYTEDEVCTLIEGAVVLTHTDGTAHRYEAGDSFVIPSGFEGTWESIGSVRKLYVIVE